VRRFLDLTTARIHAHTHARTPGGFSYADVLDSAKGWAATIRFNEKLLKQFQV
jgi:phosphoribosylformylglycinamidine (FGAM) synthase-like amidotransferase family enzyme